MVEKFLPPAILKLHQPVEIQREIHVVNKGKIEVHARRFKPAPDKIQAHSHSSADLFYTGFSIPETTQALERYCQTIADKKGNTTYALNTPSFNIDGDPMPHEAEAGRRFISNLDVDNVTIYGYSRGASKAIHTVHQLQEHTNIKVNGLVLLNPVGLYRQSFAQLVSGLARDFIQTEIATLQNSSRRNEYANAYNLFFTSFAYQGEEILHENKNYISKLKKELMGIEQVNPHTHEITCPIVIMTGAKDPLSDPAKIIPNHNRKKGEEPYLPTLEERHEHLTETLFSKSNSVTMLVGKNKGHHGLPALRPETLAILSHGLIERQKTDEKPRTKPTKRRILYEKKAV